MCMPIQRQSETYGAFDDGSHRFAKDYETHDLPEGLVNMLAGRRISAGLNDPRRMNREADLGSAIDTLGKIPGQFNDAANAAVPDMASSPNGTGIGAIGGDLADLGKGMGAGFGAVGSGIGDAWNSLTAPNVTQGTPTAPPGVGTPTPTNINASHQAGFGAHPDSSGFGREDLSGHGGYDPQEADRREFNDREDYFDQAPPLQDPGGFGFGGYEDYDPHSSENLPPDYGAQFGPHMSSFTTARSVEGGPAPKQSVTAAAVQPQVVPGWVGHGYAPGHRVGLPWRDRVIPGTVTHLPGQEVGIRWDDGQHSTEQPSDLRPI